MWTGLNFTYDFHEGLALHISPEHPQVENLPGLLALRTVLTAGNAVLKIEAGFLPAPAIFSGAQLQAVIDLLDHLIVLLETPGSVDFQGDTLTLTFPFVATTKPEFSMTIGIVIAGTEPLPVFPSENCGFEAAFPDMSFARETAKPVNLWAIQTSRLALKISGSPLFAAPRPLSTQLCGGAVEMPVMPDGVPPLPAALTFSGIDVDVWYRSFVAFASQATVADREAIATSFAGQVDWPFKPGGPPASLAEARDLSAQVIKEEIEASYAFDTAVQYPLDSDPKITLQVEVGNAPQGVKFSKSRVGTTLTFLVGVDDPANTKEIRIEPTGTVTGFDKDGVSMRPISPLPPIALGQTMVPVLLRQYPEQVQPVTQMATPTPNLNATSLDGIGLWEYSAEYHASLTPHDTPGTTVAFNSRPSVRVNAPGNTGLFNALARFISAIDSLQTHRGEPAVEALIQTLIADVAAQSFPPNLSEEEAALVPAPARIAGLNVLQTESAIASFQVERNSGAEPGFLYQTPIVSFAAPVVPYVEVSSPIQVQTVAAMLKSVVGKSPRLIALGCELQISVTPGLVTTVPIIQTGPIQITPATVDEISADTELAITHAAHHSSQKSGTLIFNITVYTRLAEHPVPLLKFTNLQREFVSASKSGPGSTV
jgi:hypothetical protein